MDISNIWSEEFLFLLYQLERRTTECYSAKSFGFDRFVCSRRAVGSAEKQIDRKRKLLASSGLFVRLSSWYSKKKFFTPDIRDIHGSSTVEVRCTGCGTGLPVILANKALRVTCPKCWQKFVVSP